MIVLLAEIPALRSVFSGIRLIFLSVVAQSTRVGFSAVTVKAPGRLGPQIDTGYEGLVRSPLHTSCLTLTLNDSAQFGFRHTSHCA